MFCHRPDGFSSGLFFVYSQSVCAKKPRALRPGLDLDDDNLAGSVLMMLALVAAAATRGSLVR